LEDHKGGHTLLTTKSNFASVLQPDVAVLDCQLPGMSGPQVAVEIKRRGLPTKVLAPSTEFTVSAAEGWPPGRGESGRVG